MTAFLQLLKFSFILLSFYSVCFSQTKRAIFEGTPASNNAIFIQTTTPKVGINKTDPLFTLDVNGDINFSGNLYKNGVLYEPSSTVTVNTESFNYEFFFSTAEISTFKKLTNVYDLSDLEYIEKITNINGQFFESFITSFTFGSNEILSNKLEIEIYAIQTQGESDIRLVANIYKYKNNTAISIGTTNSTDIISKNNIGKYKMSLDLGLENFDNSQLIVSLFCLVSGETSVNNKLKVYFGKNYPSKVKIFYVRNFNEQKEGDNLGNHIATTTLNMNNNNIINAYKIYANYFYGDGSNLTNISGDNLGNHTATQDLNLGNYNLNFFQTHDVGTRINANYPISFVIAGSTKAKLNIYGLGVNGAEATGTYNVNVNGGVNSSVGFFVNGNPIPTSGDNLGNHTATQDLNLNLKNIKAVKKISVGVDENGYTKENPVFSGDFVGDLAIQKGKIFISTNTIFHIDTGFNRFNYMSWGQSCYPLNVYGAKMAVEDGQYGTAYNGCSTENSWYVQFASFSNIVNLPDNAVIVGIEAKIKGYSSGTRIGNYLRLCNFTGSSCYPYYNTNIVSNYNMPTTDTTLYFGGPNNTWGLNFTPQQAKNLGLDIEFVLQPYTTFYVDAIQLKVYYVLGNYYEFSIENSSLTIKKDSQKIIEISTNGLNVIGEYYKNGVLFSGGGSVGDNLGNHIATTSLNMNNFSIFNVSSITIKGDNVNNYEQLFNVAGSTFMIFKDGRVGIGSEPLGNEKLRVNGFVNILGNLRTNIITSKDISIESLSGNKSYLYFKTIPAIPNPDISSYFQVSSNDVGNDTKFSFFIKESYNGIFREAITVSSFGFVGINNSTPTTNLDVNGNIKASTISVSTINAYDIVSTNINTNKLAVSTNLQVGNSSFVVLNDGRIGFGMNPTSLSRFDFAEGTARFRRNLSTTTKFGLFPIVVSQRNTDEVAGIGFNTYDWGPKAGLFFRRVDSYDRGDLFLSFNLEENDNPAKAEDSKFVFNRRGMFGINKSAISPLSATLDVVHSTYTTATKIVSISSITGNNNIVEIFNINTNGRVGINTTNPSTTLDVNGNVKASTISANSLCLNDNCITNWNSGSGDAVLSATQTWTGINTFNNNTIFNGSITINNTINNQYIGYVDLTNATNDYLLRRGEKAFITFTNTTSVPLRIQTFSGTAYKLVYFLSNNSGNSGGTLNPIYLNPNNTTYSNQFYYAEVYRNNTGFGSVVNTYSSFRIGWSFSSGFAYLYNYVTNKRIVGELNIWGHSYDTSTLVSFATAWTNTTTPWTSLGTITFPQSSSGVVIVERIF